ncbi:MAG: hypothetical protein NT129_06080 [Candidatus Aenigmarchaeota archaeon]|nr:hypothetical protein [Candidatus Aenigmarchaeota archaeon]
MQVQYIIVSLILMVIIIVAIVALLGGLPDIGGIIGSLTGSGGG